MVLCAELSGTHGGHTGRACYNLISAALLLQSKEQQATFFKVFSFSLLLKVRKEVPVEKNRDKRGKTSAPETINSPNLLQQDCFLIKGQFTLFFINIYSLEIIF